MSRLSCRLLPLNFSDGNQRMDFRQRKPNEQALLQNVKTSSVPSHQLFRPQQFHMMGKIRF
jgi:hypothetical protein